VIAVWIVLGRFVIHMVGVFVPGHERPPGRDAHMVARTRRSTSGRTTVFIGLKDRIKTDVERMTELATDW
jgi:hypothetical protein